MIARYKYQIFLFFISSLFIAFLSFLLQLNLQNTIYPDSRDYVVAAKNLFIFHRGHPGRPILMAFITGLPYLFTQSSSVIFQLSFYVNLILWFGSVFLLFSILKNIVKPKKAFFTTLLFLFCIGNVVYVFHILTETIFVFMLLLFFYFLQKYLKAENYFHLSAAISILILSMLVKPSSKILAIFVFLYFSSNIFRNLKNKYSVLIYGALLLILIQCAGIKYQFGNFTISYIDKVTAYNYLFTKAKCFENGTTFSQINNPRAEYLFTTTMSDRNEIVKADIINQLQYNTSNVLKAYFHNLSGNMCTGNVVVFDAKNVLKIPTFADFKSFLYLVTQFQNLFFSLFGLILSFYTIIKFKKSALFFTVISLFIIYFIFTSGISSDQGDRFHLVFYPLVIILIAKTFSKTSILSSEPLHK